MPRVNSLFFYQSESRLTTLPPSSAIRHLQKKAAPKSLLEPTNLTISYTAKMCTLEQYHPPQTPLSFFFLDHPYLFEHRRQAGMVFCT